MTVSALIEDAGRYLVVEEVINGRPVMNQPAGHVEDGESLIDAVVREVREEICRHFEPVALTGLYRWREPTSGTTFMRVNFTGRVSAIDDSLARDPDIVGVHWLDRDALAQPGLCRSPLVLRCIDDALAGRTHSLELLHELD